MPEKAVVMLYKRIQEKSAKNIIIDGDTYTPHEYKTKLRSITGCDISELVYMVERASYEQKSLKPDDKAKAKAVYKRSVKAVKAWQKKNRKKTIRFQ